VQLDVAPKIPGRSTGVSRQRAGRLELSFSRHGAQTRLGRQFVSYPFHLTRPFALDAAIPALLTVYQQSASGGIYRADRLSSRYHIGPAAAVHVTTQSATVIYDCQGEPAHQFVEIDAREDAFLAYAPDPVILLPGAALACRLDIKVGPRSVVLAGEAVTSHDPAGEDRLFDRLTSDTIVQDASARLLCRDRLAMTGEQFADARGLVRSWSVAANYLLIGPTDRLPEPARLRDINSSSDAIVGVTNLPNRAGLSVRLVAPTAIAARVAGERIFVLTVEAALGKRPVSRPK
jgi:urease accessory protein